MYIAPRSIIDDLFQRGPQAVAAYDPLADGLLMQHQKDWVADEADIKIAEKGRRTGITWGEAFADVLIAAASKRAGGDNVWYIGDTKDKGREFIKTCAGFAEKLGKGLLEIEEFLFDDVDEAGNTRQITAWRITFASGHRISALSSNPANIRGLQGVVVIDEAAFHANVGAVLEACVALLIWGGKIRIISTHNGKANAFNQLIREAREGRLTASIHHVTFDDAVANGLYERVCATTGKAPTPEGKQAWYQRIRNGYGTRTAAMKEELDAVPREGDGTMIPQALIEACMTADYRVARWEKPEPKGGVEFVDWPELERRAQMSAWLVGHVDPLLDGLPIGPAYAFGEDFAMRQDRTAIAPVFTDQSLIRHVPFLVELRECPYDQQKQALFHIVRFLADERRLVRGILDANGNGMVLAQEARQAFGAERITELMPNDAWLREITPKFATAFQDRSILLPSDRDIRDDLHQFRVVNGVGKIPSDVRKEGTDGGRRHGDAAVAILNAYAATFAADERYDYRPVRVTEGRPGANHRRVRTTHGLRARKGLL